MGIRRGTRRKEFQAEGIVRAGVWGRCMLGTGGKARKPVGWEEGVRRGRQSRQQTVKGFLGPTGQNWAFPLNGMGGQEGFGIEWQNSCAVTESF